MLEHEQLFSKGERQVRQLQEELTSRRRKALETDGSAAGIRERDDYNEKDIRGLEMN